MGLRDAIIISILLSQSLCEVRGRNIAGTLLQGLLSSNPQLGRMLSNKFQQGCLQRPYYNAPILNAQTQVIPTVSPISSIATVPVSNAQYAQYQNYQKPYNQAKIEYPQTQVYAQKECPKEVQYQAVAVPNQSVSYSTVQTTQAVPADKPSPFISPAAMVNPFLPAASPISALCPPTSSLLPPAIPSLARSQFLRKVPIPPPCL